MGSFGGVRRSSGAGRSSGGFRGGGARGGFGGGHSRGGGAGRLQWTRGQAGGSQRVRDRRKPGRTGPHTAEARAQTPEGRARASGAEAGAPAEARTGPEGGPQCRPAHTRPSNSKKPPDGGPSTSLRYCLDTICYYLEQKRLDKAAQWRYTDVATQTEYTPERAA